MSKAMSWPLARASSTTSTHRKLAASPARGIRWLTCSFTSAARAMPDRLLDGRDGALRPVARVRREKASGPPGLAGERDELLLGGAFLGRVFETDRVADRPLREAFAQEIPHRGDLGRRRRAIGEPERGEPQLRVRHQRHDVDGRAGLPELLQVAAHAASRSAARCRRSRRSSRQTASGRRWGRNRSRNCRSPPGSRPA